MPLLGLITRALLLLALFGTGSVPDGTMRVARAEGMRLVLCTTEGTQEVWLGDDGKVTPVGEGQTGQDHDGQHCVQVSVAGTEAPPYPGTLIRLPPWPMASPMIAAQRPVSQYHFHRNRSRAPPLPV